MFNRLQTYTVHLGPKPEDSPELVREGFSVWAFLFGAAWTLYHRAWLTTLLLAIFGVCCYLLEERLGMQESLIAAIQFGVQLWLGFEAPDIRRDALARRGWRMVDVICEANEERAVLRYYVDRPRPAIA